MEELVVFDDFGGNGDGIDRVRETFLKDSKGVFVHIIFHEYISQLNIGLRVLTINPNSFLINLNRILMEILLQLNLGPIEIHIIEIRKLLQTLNNITLNRFKLIM